MADRESFYRDWFIAAFDESVAAAPSGQPVAESRKHVARAYADAVDAGVIGRWTEEDTMQGEALFNRFVEPARSTRRRDFRNESRHIVEALNGDTILGVSDPVFAMAYPIGDGTDKRLGAWTVEDWMAATASRTENAERAASASREFTTEVAIVVIGALVRQGAVTTEELFEAPE